MADKNGNTIVYNDKDVPIGTGSVQKLGERSYQVSKNLRISFTSISDALGERSKNGWEYIHC